MISHLLLPLMNLMLFLNTETQGCFVLACAGQGDLGSPGCLSCGWFLMKYINNLGFGEVKQEKGIVVYL